MDFFNSTNISTESTIHINEEIPIINHDNFTFKDYQFIRNGSGGGDGNNDTNSFRNITSYNAHENKFSFQFNNTILLQNNSNDGDINLSNFNDINTTVAADTINVTTIGNNNIPIEYNEIFSLYGLGLVSVFCIFVVITIIGNTLVILAVVTTRRLRTVTNCFVMSLAVADLLVGIFVMPPAVAVHLIGSWQLGWVLCDIWISLDVLLCTASILSLCAISVDRYLAVTQPLTYSRKRRSKRLALIMILIVWLLALAITCPPILGWYEPGRRGLTECRYNQNEGYVIFSAMGSFFIPMAVMIYVYAKISCVIATRHDNMTDINIHNKKNRKFTDTEREVDQDTSEPEVSPNQKKEIAARTLSNQTVDSAPNITITNTTDLDENTGQNGGYIRESKNCDYELINVSSSCKLSFKKSQPLSASTTIDNFKGSSNTAPLNASSAKSSPQTGLLTPEQWTSYGHQRQQSVRHYGNTTCIVSGGSDTYITRNTRVHHQKSLSNRISSLKKENKTTQTLSIVVGGFIACWLPFFIYYIITPFLSKESQNPSLAEFLTWLGWFNSAINPFIYAFYSVDFRAAFWRLTLRRFFQNSTKGQFPNNTLSIRR